MRRPDLRSALVSILSLVLIVAGCATSTGPAASSLPATSTGPVQVESREARARTQLQLGQRAFYAGQTAAATIPLREALRLDPDLADARLLLGQALYLMGDLEGAVEELRVVVRQIPERAWARYFLATVLMAKQDWVSARRELDEVLRQLPDMIDAHYSLGFVRYSQGDLNGAIDAYRQVLGRRPDHVEAHYSLGVVLKIAQGDAGATKEFLAAAEAGHPRAQYFAGTAYSRGFGVEPNLALAIMWWSRAADQEVLPASAALAEVRQVMLGRSGRGSASRATVEKAFEDYRATIWSEYPELVRDGPDDTAGAALLRQSRGHEAVTVLIREAKAFSEPALGQLEALYYHGLQGQIRAHDARILDYLQAAAAEGRARARIALARFYAGGLGVPQDTARAINLLKSTPHEDAQRLLQELLASSPAPVRP